MFPNQFNSPSETMIAGTTRNLIFYLYTEGKKKQIDATGMSARFCIFEYVNESDTPLLSKLCNITIPEGESTAVIAVPITRADTLNLYGKYIYTVTINDSGTIGILKGELILSRNDDRATI